MRRGNRSPAGKGLSVSVVASDKSRAVVLFQDLLDGYYNQLDDYRQWLALAQQANARVDDDELDEFLRLHGEKDEVAQRLREHEEQLRAKREQLCAELQIGQFTLTELERAKSRVADPDAFLSVLNEFNELLARLGAVMRDLEPVERETERRLRGRLHSLRGELKDVHSTRHATRAYNNFDPDSREARFIDHKG